ncbi:hypothetical protein OHA40_16765 [Nocardia sp. NBC_00508]|uniref:hypothetical protein n=1 Tax=Nocardia sp. NBC_00508 TaxID=2975992 RepID=UPI002E81A0BD|nr:hypothetical protein [Nocardia sp. NBC_00508]WUD69621.1 hypothetical protein OHA40_16765 [Nocardia sp. NBC_00508]
MKRGFVTETHVVVYCDGCGDHYTEGENEAICFDSVHQAVTYLNARSGGVGWRYDGDRVLCDGCLATARCAEHGHRFPEAWHTTRWPLGSSTRSRTCEVCGIPEIEALP